MKKPEPELGEHTNTKTELKKKSLITIFIDSIYAMLKKRPGMSPLISQKIFIFVNRGTGNCPSTGKLFQHQGYILTIKYDNMLKQNNKREESYYLGGKHRHYAKRYCHVNFKTF